jgi:curli biogenesis system outer membrane secretion channel CsgG
MKRQSATGRRARLFRRMAPLPLLALVAACATPATQRVAPGEVPIVLGPPVRDNVTPMEGVIACFADHVASTGHRPFVISVGEVKDYTGKYSINEGNAITQGGALMVYSALGKMGGVVKVAERFDPTIAERELAYIDRRQLGDGDPHQLGGPDGAQRVPWLPYFGGTIRQSDYFIVGGITELNYDINSGGAEAGVNQIGAKARIYNEQVGIDLRIVDTQTLLVVDTVSLTKQFIGYETGLNIFRFFGSDLFDINIGAKGQEPLQLGIRAALEEAVVRLVSSVTKVDYRPCMDVRAGTHVETTPAEELRTVANPSTPSVTQPAATAGVPVNRSTTTATAPAGSDIQVSFEFGSAQLMGDSLARMDQIAALAKNGGGAVVLLTARDTENFDPGKRDRLISQRIAAITSALASRGVAPAAIRVTWQPDPSDTSIHRDGPGMQELARLKVGG